MRCGDYISSLHWTTSYHLIYMYRVHSVYIYFFTHISGDLTITWYWRDTNWIIWTPNMTFVKKIPLRNPTSLRKSELSSDRLFVSYVVHFQPMCVQCLHIYFQDFLCFWCEHEEHCEIWNIFPWQKIRDFSKKSAAPRNPLLKNLQRSARKTIILSLRNPAIYHPLKYSQNISVRKSQILNTFNFIILIKCVSNQNLCNCPHIKVICVDFMLFIIFKIFCVFWCEHKEHCEICDIFPWQKFRDLSRKIAAPRNPVLSGKTRK